MGETLIKKNLILIRHDEKLLFLLKIACMLQVKLNTVKLITM